MYEYSTAPGVLVLLLRACAAVAFLLCLGARARREQGRPERMSRLLHLGAASLVWFSYLPLAALVAVHISALWRQKFLSGVSLSADAFAYAVAVNLLWPGRDGRKYLLLATSTTVGSSSRSKSMIPNIGTLFARH